MLPIACQLAAFLFVFGLAPISRGARVKKRHEEDILAEASEDAGDEEDASALELSAQSARTVAMRGSADAGDGSPSLRCSGNTFTLDGLATDVYDLVSFEVGSEDTTARMLPWLHIVAAVVKHSATATLPSSAIAAIAQAAMKSKGTPDLQFNVRARAHMRGPSEGSVLAWSDTLAPLACTLDKKARVVQSPYPTLPAAKVPTRWLEVFRGINDPLPDHLDDHNVADLAAEFGGPVSAEWKRNCPTITRYCIEVEDVSLPGIQTGTTTGKPTAQPFADYLSCDMHEGVFGCRCTTPSDLMLSRVPRDLFIQKCLDKGKVSRNCKCTAEQMKKSLKYTGMMVEPFPYADFNFALEDGIVPMSYPLKVDDNKSAHWYSLPEAGRCPHGAPVGTKGCTWQRVPIAHTISYEDLMLGGFIEHGLGKPSYDGYEVDFVPTEISKFNTLVGMAVFEKLGVQPCGPGISARSKANVKAVAKALSARRRAATPGEASARRRAAAPKSSSKLGSRSK